MHCFCLITRIEGYIVLWLNPPCTEIHPFGFTLPWVGVILVVNSIKFGTTSSDTFCVVLEGGGGAVAASTVVASVSGTGGSFTQSIVNFCRLQIYTNLSLCIFKINILIVIHTDLKDLMEIFTNRNH